MGALVSLQLVGAGEALATEGPGADERPLARVPAQMGAQVGRLAVDLVAAGDVADVLLFLAGVAPAERHGSEGGNFLNYSTVKSRIYRMPNCLTSIKT